MSEGQGGKARHKGQGTREWKKDEKKGIRHKGQGTREWKKE